MSWFTKLVGLDKRPILLGLVNAMAREGMSRLVTDAIDRAASTPLKKLAADGDTRALLILIQSQLTHALMAPSTAQEDELLGQLTREMTEAALQ